jgi:hypothetical protein
MKFPFRRRPVAPTVTVAPFVAGPETLVYVDPLASARAAQLAPPFRAVDDPHDATLALVAPNRAVVARLRERYPDLLVLAIVPMPRDRGGTALSAELLHAGADACLVQPEPAEVQAQLRALVRRRRDAHDVAV